MILDRSSIRNAFNSCFFIFVQVFDMVEYKLSALPSAALSHWIAKRHTVFEDDMKFI